jgi:hypothetical protein
VVVKNQLLATIKISDFSVPSSFEPGGRRFESVRARIIFEISSAAGDKGSTTSRFEPPTDNKPVRQLGQAFKGKIRDFVHRKQSVTKIRKESNIRIRAGS